MRRIAPLPRTLATLLVAAWLAGGAHAQTAMADSAKGDAVLQFLLDKGLLAREAPGKAAAVARQVRDAASDLVISAMNFIGVRYRLGGNSAEEGFDCSGFTRHIFQNSLGLVLPRRADEQAHAQGVHQVPRDDLRPGDLVFFNTLRRTFSHVGIYIGDGKFIHAPRTGAEVRIESMTLPYWQRRYTGARRVEAMEVLQVSAAEPAAARRTLTP
jgi:cell wall-associated NlpC family hydrolase